MSEAKHTPAPWWPWKNSTGSWGVKTHRDNENPIEAALEMSPHAPNLVFLIGDHTEKRTSGDTIEANAHLIAASPDMYEAIEALLKLDDNEQFYTSDGDRILNLSDTKEFKTLEAALAKARGEA